MCLLLEIAGLNKARNWAMSSTDHFPAGANNVGPKILIFFGLFDNEKDLLVIQGANT